MRTSSAKSKVVVLVTDGRSNAGQLGPESAAEAARALGFKVYTIGVGSEGRFPVSWTTRRGTALRQGAGRFRRGLPAEDRRDDRARYFRAADADGFAKAFQEIDGSEKTEMREPHAHPLHGEVRAGAASRGSPPRASSCCSRERASGGSPDALRRARHPLGASRRAALARSWSTRARAAGRALAAFAGREPTSARFRGEVSVDRRAAKAIALLVAATAGIVAAARPQWGHGTETITRKGIDLAIVLDTSKSMAAADVAPSRLARGVRAASSLLDQLEGDRVALVTFAGKPAIACPLTLDHEAVRLFLDAVDVEAVSVPGTALAVGDRGRRSRARAATAEGTEAKGRALIVISDGEDHEGGVEGAIAAVKRAGVVVYGVGLRHRSGAPIPDGESGAYKKDAEGSSSRPVSTSGRYGRSRSRRAESTTAPPAAEGRSRTSPRRSRRWTRPDRERC